MMAVAMFANVTATGGCQSVSVELHRDGVGPMIANDFGGDLRVRPDRGNEGVYIRLGFVTGYTRPLTFDRRLELCECCVGHTDNPGVRVTNSATQLWYHML